MAPKKRFTTDRYALPDGFPTDRSYEWKRVSVLGRPDKSYSECLKEEGWRRVRIGRKYLPVRNGLALMERPLELTAEARADEHKAALKAFMFEPGLPGGMPFVSKGGPMPDDQPSDSPFLGPWGGPREHHININTPENDWNEAEAFAAIDRLKEERLKAGGK